MLANLLALPSHYLFSPHCALQNSLMSLSELFARQWLLSRRCQVQQTGPECMLSFQRQHLNSAESLGASSNRKRDPSQSVSFESNPLLFVIYCLLFFFIILTRPKELGQIKEGGFFLVTKEQKEMFSEIKKIQLHKITPYNLILASETGFCNTSGKSSDSR